MFNFSIRTTLMMLFGAMGLIIVGQGVFSYNKISAVNESTLDLATNWLPSVDNTRQLAIVAARTRIALSRHILNR